MLSEVSGASFWLKIPWGSRFADKHSADDGYLLSTEWPMYAFDAIPMAGVLVVCNLWYVGAMDLMTNRRGSIPLAAGRGEQL